MVDNVVLNSGTGGETLATDDIGGIQHQRVKVQHGADGLANDVSTASPLPVDLRASNATQTVDGTVTANLSAVDNAVLDSIDTNTTGLNNCVSGSEIQADIVAPIPAGTNNIGDVDIVKVGSVVDANNSTTTPLGSSATFTGTGTDLLGYSAVTCTLFADQDSAASGMQFQYSTDNSNWDDTYSFSMDVSASGTRRFQFPVCARYFRINYINGSTIQGAFRVQTILHTANQLTSIHRLESNMNADRSAQVVKAVMFGKGQGGSPDYMPIDVTNGGNLKTAVEEFNASLPAGTNNIGDVDIASAIPAGSNLIGDVGISGARTSGGTSIFRSIDIDESEEEIKNSAGQVYWIHAMNLSASALFLKFYNATAASVTVGTTTPVLTLPLATQGDTNGAGFTLTIPNGIAFGTAITVACTTGVADNDTGAPGANACVVNIGYA